MQPSLPPVVPDYAHLSSSPLLSRFQDSFSLIAEQLLKAPFRAVGPKTIERVLSEIVIDSCAPILTGILDPQSEFQALDLGCGCGIPCLPLAVVCSAAKWYGVDSSTKRIDYGTSMAAQLALSNMTFQSARAGSYGSRATGLIRQDNPPPQLQKFLGACHVVLARGTAQVPEVLSMAAGFLRSDGRVLIYSTESAATAALGDLPEALTQAFRFRTVLYNREGVSDRQYAIIEASIPS